MMDDEYKRLHLIDWSVLETEKYVGSKLGKQVELILKPDYSFELTIREIGAEAGVENLHGQWSKPNVRSLELLCDTGRKIVLAYWPIYQASNFFDIPVKAFSWNIAPEQLNGQIYLMLENKTNT